MKNVVFIGTAAIDVIVSGAGAVPSPGSRSITSGTEVHWGGNAINGAMALSQLSVEGVAISVVAPWGTSWMGDILSDETSKRGIAVALDDDYRHSRGMRTPVTVVLSDKRQDPRFLCSLYTLPEFDVNDIKHADDIISDADWVHIGGLGLLPKLEGSEFTRYIQKLKKRKPDIVISGDVTLLHVPRHPRLDVDQIDELGEKVSAKWHKKIGPLIKHFDYLFPNEEESYQLVGPRFGTVYEAGHELLSDHWMGPETSAVIIKQGAKGGTLFEPELDLPIDVPAKKDVQVVDSTGAGDCWIAGFIADRIARRDDELVGAVRFGNWTAAHCIQHIGGSVSIPSYEEIRSSMPIRRG